jgi:hypothetical protein
MKSPPEAGQSSTVQEIATIKAIRAIDIPDSQYGEAVACVVQSYSSGTESENVALVAVAWKKAV